jgi:hypothetical protein
LPVWQRKKIKATPPTIFFATIGGGVYTFVQNGEKGFPQESVAQKPHACGKLCGLCGKPVFVCLYSCIFVKLCKTICGKLFIIAAFGLVDIVQVCIPLVRACEKIARRGNNLFEND